MKNFDAAVLRLLLDAVINDQVWGPKNLLSGLFNMGVQTDAEEVEKVLNELRKKNWVNGTPQALRLTEKGLRKAASEESKARQFEPVG